MSLMDRIAECTRLDLGQSIPFRAAGEDLGWVRRSLVPTLRPLKGESGERVFDASEERLELTAGHETFEQRSSAMAGVVHTLQSLDIVPEMGHELYPVARDQSAPACFALERAAMPTFGARAYGVHMHGFVRRADGLHLWVARRSRHKTTFPGMLDNLVAGGQPMGLSLEDNLVKECAEEADIPEALARQATLTGQVSYRMDIDRGLRNDTLYLFDLELPADFEPRNTDGEVESFELWPARDVLRQIETTADFKFNCNLTLMDFFLRHGLLTAQHPEYEAVSSALSAEGGRQPVL